MDVRDLMARVVVTLDADDHLDLAEDIMQLGRIRHLPVVADGQLVGILSQRDLFRAATSNLLQLARTRQREWLATVPVRAVMTPHVYSVAPTVSLRAAVELMLEEAGCRRERAPDPPPHGFRYPALDRL